MDSQDKECGMKAKIAKAIGYLEDLLRSKEYPVLAYDNYGHVLRRDEFRGIIQCLEQYEKDIKLMDYIHDLVAAKEGELWDSQAFEEFYGKLWRELSKGVSFMQALCTVVDDYKREQRKEEMKRNGFFDRFLF